MLIGPYYEVVAEYIFKMTDHTPSDWESKGVGIAALTIIILRTSFLIPVYPKKYHTNSSSFSYYSRFLQHQHLSPPF